jgi:uncharacterized membrane protein YdjX (TVP38/TMEM64 family)
VRRLAFLALTVGALALAAWLLPVREWATHVSPVLAVPLAVLLICALVPRTPISLAFGVLFGAVNGTVFAIITSCLAATIVFFAGRWAGREVLERYAGQRLRRADGWLAERGLLAVIVVRMIPIAPYGLMGYAYGASSVQTRHYFLGTAIGVVPSATTYAVIGAAVVSPASLSWLTFVPAVLGLAVSSGAAMFWRRQHQLRQHHLRTCTPARAGQLQSSQA